MTATLASGFTMANIHPPTSNLDYLHASLDFENGFGFSPATSPARDSSKNDFGGYFASAMNDRLPFFDQNDGELFNSYPQPPSLPSLSHATGFTTLNAKVIHGQVTPPGDNSPVTPKREVQSDPLPVHIDHSSPISQPSRKKRRSQRRQTSQASTNAPKRRKTAGGRKSSTDSATGGEEKDEKRRKFLERNRVAASKCRQKKKEWTANLEQTAQELAQSRTQLTMLVNSLRDEVLYLKGEVLKHDTCNCTALRKYMSRSVSQISGEPSAGDKLPLPTGPSPISDLDLDGMSFTGSPQLTVPGASPAMKPLSPT